MRRLAPLAVAVLAGALLARVAGPGATSVAAESPSGPPDFTAVVARAEPGVVHVVNYLGVPRAVPEPGEPAPESDNVGSGFVWTSDGWIVTNRHVTAGARRILVEIHGRGWFPARLVGTDRVADVAVLKIEATGLVPVVAGSPRALRVGQWLLAAGSPYRLGRSFSVGIVCGLDRSEVGVNPDGYEEFIQTDAAVNLGNSGGPLLDATGRVVGMNTAILSRTGGNQGVAFAVPIDVVSTAVEQIRKTGHVVRTTLGATVRSVAPENAVSLPGGGGVEVVRFAEESPARRGGLKPGDVILAVDGRATKSRGALQRLVWERPAGSQSVLRIRRGAELLDATVTLVLGPPSSD
jgi:S1-C subfamily serine protease